MSSNSTEFSVKSSLDQCRPIKVGNLAIGGAKPLCLIAGPCVIESEDHILLMAEKLVELTSRLSIPFIFKASFDKANRTSIKSYRGPGLEKGLEILARVKEKFGVPVLTDLHTEEQAAPVAQVCDMLQIPAFLCRQTDFVTAVGRAGKAVNVKKGQFLAPWDMANVTSKLKEVGCEDVLLTDRGTSFGYGTLVSDFRGLGMMRSITGLPVCYDATHSVQEPGGLGSSSGGKREYVPALCRAACAVGVNALFIETHDRPEDAKSDGPNMVPLSAMEALLKNCLAIDRAVRECDEQ